MLQMLIRNILIAIMVLLSLHVMSQNINFDYDDNGNRVKKYLSVTPAPGQSRKAVSDSLVDQALKYKLVVYPNPASDHVNIETTIACPTDSVRKFILYDINGRILQDKPVTQCKENVDVRTLPNGIYLLWILIGRDKTVWKIQKE